MKAVVSALIVAFLLVSAGCNKNDENTVNSIPKSHKAYPAFHLKVDNGYQTFGVDSALVTVSPGIGWLAPVYTDADGYAGTLPAGTYITGIDTVVSGTDTTYDTSSVNFGFTPGATYQFSFTRPDPFMWIDSFKIDYAYKVDSAWKKLKVDTVFVTQIADSNHAPVVKDTLMKKITQPSDTTKPPARTFTQVVAYGYWFNTKIAISDFDTLELPPDSVKTESILWGVWTMTDSFYLPRDSSYWCDSVGFKIKDSIVYDVNNQPLHVIDTLIKYGNCGIGVTKPKTVLYRTYGWTNYDTTRYFTFPDTLKGLIFDGSGPRVFTWEDQGTDTLSDTLPANVVLINALTNDTTQLSSFAFPITVPEDKEFRFPDYIIKIRTK